MADFAVDLHGDIRVQGFGLCFRRGVGIMPTNLIDGLSGVLLSPHVNAD
jgi:hypothetical protein